jgi:hypothetical protein
LIRFAFQKEPIFVQNCRVMTAPAQKLVLTVPAAQMAAFLEILKQYDFVKVDRLDELIVRFIQNAPKHAPVSDDEVADILMQMRYGTLPALAHL